METWKSVMTSLDTGKISTRVMQEMASKLNSIPNEKVQEIIRGAVSEIENLQNASDPKNALASLTPEIANNIAVLWDFSGPDGHGAYKHLPWTNSMDKDRLNYSAWLARKISELRNPGIITPTSIDDLRKNTPLTRELISEIGPTIIYNGSDAQNANVGDIVRNGNTIIPESKVFIENGKYKTTVDQIAGLTIPDTLHQPGKEIGLVSNAEHLMRIAHIINKYKPLPNDMKLRFFPVKTPEAHRQEYAELETMGLLFYIANGNATKESYPYIIHGAK